ncbi:MAG: HEPN domain-containing protein [Ignavibacteriaceae bacterium]
MNGLKYKSHEEWLKQAMYDLLTAKAMLKSKRYLYSVFMAHLSIEKGLKSIYAKVFNKDPERTHNLNYLIEKISDKYELNIPIEIDEFIKYINDKSIPTRYPEDLKLILKGFNKKNSEKIYEQTSGVLKWIQKKLI